MIYSVFSIYDIASEFFMNPVQKRTRGEAIREFIDVVNDKKNERNQIASHPEHFNLFELGKFDDATGIYECLDAPLLVGNGIDFLNKE